MRFYHQGKPIAKQRHRMANGIAYDPQSNEKRGMKFEFANQFRQQGYLNTLEGPIEAALDIRVQIPKSWSKKRKESCLIKNEFVVARPDLDNYEKFVLDVLNGIAYHDDSQIAKLSSQKRYSNNPGIEINLFQIEANDMINEHAVTYKQSLDIEDLDYIIKKANRLGLRNRQLVRVYQEKDSDGTHLYFSVQGLKENCRGDQ